MNKVLSLLLAAVVGVALHADAAQAGDAEKLLLRVEKIYLKNQASEWVLAYDRPADLEVSSETPEISFKNDGRLPAGPYWNAKFVISETLQVQGFAGGKYTRKGGVVRIGGDVSTASAISRLIVSEFTVESPTVTSSEDEAGPISVTLDFDYRDRDKTAEIYGRRNFPSPVTIKADSDISVRLGLALPDTLRLATADYFAGIRSPEAIYFLPHRDVSEISIKVGAETRILTSEVLEWSF